MSWAFQPIPAAAQLLSGPSTQGLTQSSRFDDSDSLTFAHTLTPGAVALTQSATYANDQTFYAHTLTPGAVTLVASLFSNAQSFLTHSLMLYLTPALYANGQTFYAHTLTPGVVTLAQSSRFDDSDSLTFAHTLTPGAVTLAQSSRYDDSDSLTFAHTLSVVQVLLHSARFDNALTSFAHVLRNQYPDPADVLSGVEYGPAGSPKTGTYVGSSGGQRPLYVSSSRRARPAKADWR